MSEKNKKGKGRPREHKYYTYKEFLEEAFQQKHRYLEMQAALKAIDKLRRRKLEELDNIAYVDMPGVENVGQKIRRRGPRWKTHGDGIYCPKCDKVYSSGFKFTIDEKHRPPRVRIVLPCKHRIDLPITRPEKCPKCGGELQEDKDGLLFCILCDWKEEALPF